MAVVRNGKKKKQKQKKKLHGLKQPIFIIL